MLQLSVIGVLLLVIPSRSREHTRDIYKNYANRRLESVMTSLFTSSRLKCTALCSETEGCVAVNVIGSHDITCQLTTGLSNETKFLIDPGSRVFILDYNRCVAEPGLCKNGATCEQVWTSTRCHCSNGHYGDRCDVRFLQQSNKDCNRGGDINTMPNTDLEACKIWCGNNQRCGGFAAAYGMCWFKDATCGQNIYNKTVTLYLKESSP